MATISSFVKDPNAHLDLDVLRQSWGLNDDQIKEIAAAGAEITVAAEPVTGYTISTETQEKFKHLGLKLNGRVVEATNKPYWFTSSVMKELVEAQKIVDADLKEIEAANQAIADAKVVALRERAMLARANDVFYGSRSIITSIFLALISPIIWIFSFVRNLFTDPTPAPSIFTQLNPNDSAAVQKAKAMLDQAEAKAAAAAAKASDTVTTVNA